MNIYDEAVSKGYEIDIKTMEEMLGVRVIPTVATKKTGLDDLLRADHGIATAGHHPTKSSITAATLKLPPQQWRGR